MDASIAGQIAYAQPGAGPVCLGAAALLALCVVALVVAVRSDRRKGIEGGR